MSKNQHFPPVFATNRPERDETVAEKLNFLFSRVREDFKEAPPLAIATAYINSGGFSLIADELEEAPVVRLLLGAEPNPNTYHPVKHVTEDVQQALDTHSSWLAAERDLTGFTREEDVAARRMVAWLEEKAGEGERRVEVRRFTKGFLHGKAFIAEVLVLAHQESIQL